MSGDVIVDIKRFSDNGPHGPLDGTSIGRANRLTAISVLVGYRFPMHARVHVGALGRLAFVHVSFA